MFNLPEEFSRIISVFSPLFSKKVFEHASQLMLGTLLTQGKRTVCGVLRSLGLSDEPKFHKYHRVLSRAKWSALSGARALLKLLIHQFVNSDVLVFGIDETIERRWGPKIRARGIYRDAVRSSKGHFVKCSGLRWISVMLLTEISWANRLWALPFLTVLAPSEKYHEKQGLTHKKLSDWSRQICFLLKRWLPDYHLILIGDGAYTVMECLAATLNHVTWITRFRLDAALFDFPPPYKKGQMGRPPTKGKKLPSLEKRLADPKTKWKQVRFSNWYDQKNKLMEVTSEVAIWYRAGKAAIKVKWVLIRDPEAKIDPIAIQCTDLKLTAIEIVQHYLKRWNVEVTFEEVRAHLGVETQRQWSDLSIARTTPTLMSLFSIATLWADQLKTDDQLTIFQTAWYQKPYPTFSDAVASIRYRIWQYQLSSQSLNKRNCKESRTILLNHLAFMAARAA